MSDKKPDLTPEYDEYSLATILQEYTHRNASTAQQPPAEKASAEPPAAESAPEPTPAAVPAETSGQIADRARAAAMSALGETLRQYRQAASEPETPQPQEAEAPAAVSDALKQRPIRQESAPQKKTAPRITEPSPEPKHPRVTVGEDGIITLRYGNDEEEIGTETAAPPPVSIRQQYTERRQPPPRRSEPEEAPAAEPTADDEEPVRNREQTNPSADETEYQSSPSIGERLLAPVVRIFAQRIALRQMQKAEAENWPEPVELRETPELTPSKAAKYYSSLLGPLKLRLRFSLILTLILAWISLRLPMMGLLKHSIPLQAGVSLVLLLAVMVAALDVVTAGLRQLFDFKPGAEALAAIAAILSCADAALVLFGWGEALPYCAIGAASLTAALWGEELTCKALRRTFRTAAASKSPSYLAVSGEEASLLRTDREDAEGIVRRSESQDLCRTVYASAAPILLAAAILLSAASGLGGRDANFLHTLSALVSVSASFTAFIGFPLPYAIASRKLRNSGAALAGFDGCADIGRSRRLVITDEDLFPTGTMRFAEINVAEGIFVGKVVGSTAALLSAAGGGTSPLFDDLVTRRGYNIPNIEEFTVHEGGGLSGLIGGERVLVGSAGFMNLMGIRLPQNMPTQNSVCTAVSGELVGVFVIEYIPVTSVQEALVTLMRGKTKTVFAIRDFNITPRMIGKLFRLPTDNFNFPSFRERYRIVGETADDSPIDAVISRSGMLPLVETAEAAVKAYNTCRISAILSLVGAGIGMIIMFLLCRVGSYDTASAGNVLSFMVLWALPAVILSLGQGR